MAVTGSSLIGVTTWPALRLVTCHAPALTTWRSRGESEERARRGRGEGEERAKRERGKGEDRRGEGDERARREQEGSGEGVVPRRTELGKHSAESI